MELNLWFSILYILAFLTGCIIFIFLPKKNHSRRGYLLGYFFLSVSIWALSSLFESTSESLEVKQLWYQLSFIGKISSPVLFLFFTFDFAQKNKWFSPLYYILFSIVPLATVALVFTNPAHHLFWAKPTSTYPVGTLNIEHTRYYWYFVYYVYILLIVGVINVFRNILNFSQAYTNQLILFGLATIIPIVLNLLSILHLIVVYGVDLTPLGFMISGVLVMHLIVNYHFIDLAPLARQQIIDSMSDAFVVTDTQCRILITNHAFINTFCKPENNALNQKLSRYIDIDPVNYKNRPTTEYVYGDKYYDIKISELKSKSQQANGYLVSLRDISIRKAYEQALVHTNTKLQHEIREHEQVISELDWFSRTVAHDLKNPLGNLINYTELIESHLHNPNKIAVFLSDMRILGNKMTEIIENLLKLASVNHRIIDLAAMDMNASLDFALRRLSHLISHTGASITKNKQLPEAIGHSPWIEEVWMNYISNAIKYGGTPPSIAIGHTWINKNTIKYTVTDNGPGIEPEKHKLVFKEFTRLKPHETEGHGLGLSIVKKIIEKHNGVVGLESDGTNGCTFYFTLVST